MILPELNDVFYNNGFTDDVSPELEEAHSNTSLVIEKLKEAYNITPKDYNDLDLARGNEAILAQCHGFTQGFMWAVYLFTGHKKKEVSRK